MNQLKLLTHIISTCDEALAETFQKRMSIAAKMAESKRDLDEEIFDDDAELAYVRSVAAQFPPELLLKANSLWSSITRMHRGHEYRWILKNNLDHKLPHEQVLTDLPAEGRILCPAHQLEDVAATLQLELEPCASIDEALDMVEKGEAAYAVFSCGNNHDLADIYLRFYKRDLYLNRSFRPYITGDDRRYFVLSKKLVKAEDCDRMSLAFAVKRTYGSLTQTLSILAEAKLNIENLRLRRSTPGDGHPDDLIFVDLSGNFDSIETRAALYQMELEMYYFRVLGFWRHDG